MFNRASFERLRIRVAALVGFACLASVAPAFAQQLPDYTLSPGDQIEVSVWKEEGLTKTVIVRPDGKFSFALVGEVQAAGRTVSQVQAEVASRLQKYIPDPVVTAAVTNLDGNRVYVIGQVNKPGAYPMNPRLNVLQALTLAGGLTPFANVDGINVLRGAGGRQRVLQFRFGDVSKGRSLEQNVSLEAGDVIVVP